MSNSPVIAGFHACNNNALTGRDRDIIRMVEAGAITFLTGPGQKFLVDEVLWALSINPACNFFPREYLDPGIIGDKRDSSTRDYSVLDNYISGCKHTIAKFHDHIPAGQMHFQVFNEPNMPWWAQWEGFGSRPTDMKRFNEQFVKAVTALKRFAPDVRYGLTPLTPGNRDVWFHGNLVGVHCYLHGPEAAYANITQTDIHRAMETCLCKDAIDIADEYYFHLYIHKDSEPVDHPAYGLRYERYLKFLPQKPFWILECGYPNATMWKGDKRLLDWFKLLDTREVKPEGVTFWILGEKKDWGNMFAPKGVIRPFVYDLKKYLNERESPEPEPEPEPEPTPTEINIYNQRNGWNIQEFKRYLANHKTFALIDEVFIHHTVNPTPTTWRGRKSILAMKRVYEKKGWTAGPHVFVAPDGIWAFTPIDKQGVGCVGHNRYAIHVEIVGNYDRDNLSGVMKRNAIDAFREICLWLYYDPLDMVCHRDFADTICPGKNIGDPFKYDVLNSLLRHEAGKRVGTEVVRLNEDSAFHKRTQIKGLTSGAPLTNEFECCGYIVQGFAFAILRAKKGNWKYIEGISW